MRLLFYLNYIQIIKLLEGKMSNENRRSWNKHARRYQKKCGFNCNVAHYLSEAYPMENELNLLGNVSGLEVLEIGSGAGQCGIAMAKQGAHVTCLDISEEQIAIGCKYAGKENVNVNFVQGDMEDLSLFSSDLFDLVFSAAAISYVERIDKVFSEVFRVLKDGGRFLFSSVNPFWFALGATELWPEENNNPSYFYRGPDRWKWNEEDDFEFITYRRPLQDYFNSLIDAGLHIKKFIELEPVLNRLTEDTFFFMDEKEIEMAKRFPQGMIVLSEKPF